MLKWCRQWQVFDSTICRYKEMGDTLWVATSPLWLKLTMLFLLLKYFLSISVFLKFIILYTPSQFSLRKSKICNGHWFTLHVSFFRIVGQFWIHIRCIFLFYCALTNLDLSMKCSLPKRLYSCSYIHSKWPY